MLFNQRVKSDLFLPQAVSIEPVEQADIVIELGEPPLWVLEKAMNGQIDYIEGQVIWFYLKGHVLYYIENGNYILIYQESDKISDISLRSYLLGSAISYAIMQRKYIPLHGGTVAMDGQAIIVSGESGTGKSTITLELHNQGFMFVADDLSVIELKEKGALVFPAYPQQKLCRDVVEKSGLDIRDLTYIDEYRDKYARILTKDFATKPISVSCMIELIVSDNTERVVFEAVKGADKVKQLIRNIYRGEVYQSLENRMERFHMLLRAASLIPMYRITRPGKGDYVAEIIQYIKNQLVHYKY